MTVDFFEEGFFMNQTVAGNQTSMQDNNAQQLFHTDGGSTDTTLVRPYHSQWNPFITSSDGFITSDRQITYDLPPIEIIPTLQTHGQNLPTTHPSNQSHPFSYLHHLTNNVLPSSPTANSMEFLAQQAQSESASPLSSPASSNPPSPRTKSHSCPSCTLVFTRLSDLQRHFRTIHLRLRHHCLVLGCGDNRGRGFCREEKLRTHLKERHQYF